MRRIAVAPSSGPSRKALPLLSNPSNSSPSNPAIPTAAQLAEARRKQWHQQGEALLTLENLRSWINAAGLVLYAPRPQIASPAPSLVEAVLGEANPTPTLAETAEARGLMARLIAEGLAVPLNLLGPTNGAAGETPDFVASTAVFSYVFTLRGDKAWKQPPATSGALKVSHLALAAHEALSKRGPLSAYDLTAELGKEVTEAAVLRALNELWTHLRVLPLAQPEAAPTLWELASTRFTKQIKAGANAGQPSALSALISLYLGQAVVAAEDEIESFLSPLAARSRIRDVIHALLAARQLDTLAVEGRTVLHVAGELPTFLAAEPLVAPEVQPVAAESIPLAEGEADGAKVDATGEATPRITKYIAKPRKIGTGYLAKASPAKFGAKPFGLAKPGASRFGAKPGSFGARGFKPGATPDRERRPFGKPASATPARGFDRPWEEEKARRLAAAAKPSDGDPTPIDFAASGAAGSYAAEAQTQPRAPRISKPHEDRAPVQRGDDRRPAFGAKPAFRGKPALGSKPAFGSRPAFGESRPPRRDFAPRADREAGDPRPPRKTFSKPGTFARKREGAKPGDARPARRDIAARGERSPARGDREGGFPPRKPYPPRGAGFFSGKPRPSEGRPDRPVQSAGGARDRQGHDAQDRGTSTESGKRVYRKFDAPRERTARPASSDRAARPGGSAGKPGGFAGKPSGFAGKPGGFAGKPSGDFASRKFAGKPSGRPGASAGRPSGKPGAGKKPFGKSSGSFAGKPTSTFAKFADNKKPFGKRPPARKFKPAEGESA